MTASRFDSAAGEGLSTAYDGFARIAAATQSLDGTARVLAVKKRGPAARPKVPVNYCP